ncbi:EamA family transporter [Candidatus Woesearchaeota archaeon]|nr:EamA family transporter [Candidatus Woesearchaeota archaeon]
MIAGIALLLVLLATLTGAGGIVLMKQGIRGFTWQVHKNKALRAGIGLFIVSTLFFITAINYGELHLLYSLTGLTYVWLLILSHRRLGEPVTKTKIIGTACIIMGVALITLG